MAKKKKLRLKKTVRRTIASLLMITAIIVAAVPAPTIRANEDESSEGEFKKDGVIWNYKTDSNGAYITGYRADPNSHPTESRAEITYITIPAVVKNDQGSTYDVYRISRINSDDGSGDTHWLEHVYFEYNEKLTTIDPDAFADNTGLLDVDFPDSVMTIGSKAFYGCTALKGTVRLGSNLKTIGDEAFSETAISGLQVNSPLLTNVNSRAFYNCTSLSNVSFKSGDNNINFGDEVFSGCKGLLSITLPANLYSMGEGVFMNCESLSAIDFSSLTRLTNNLKADTFNGCSALGTVLGLENTKITGVDSHAFAYCDKLTEIALPEKRDEDSFVGCTKVAGNAFVGCTGLQKITLPGSLDELPKGLLTDCSKKLTTIRLGNWDGKVERKDSNKDVAHAADVTISVDNDVIPAFGGDRPTIYAFSTFDGNDSQIYKYSQQKGIKFEDLGKSGGSSSTSGFVLDDDGYIIYVDYNINNQSNLDIKGTIDGKTVKGIKKSAFSTSGLNGSEDTGNRVCPYKSITLPDSCTFLDDGVFANCHKLTQLTATASSYQLGSNIFNGVATDTSLKDSEVFKVTGVISADNNLFEYVMNQVIPTKRGTTDLTNIPFRNSNDLEVGYILEVENVGIEKPNGKTWSPNGAGKTTLTGYIPQGGNSTLTIPSGVNEIDLKTTTTLDGNNDLQAFIAEENGLREIKSFLFKGDTNLNTVKLPSSITTIGDAPFLGCSSLDNVDISAAGFSCDDGVLRGPDSQGNSNAKIIEVLEGAGKETFNVSDYSGVTEIGPYALSEQPSLTKVEIANGVVTEIPEGCFKNAIELSDVTLGSTVNKIGSQAFSYTKSPTTIKVKCKDKMYFDDDAFYGEDKTAQIYNFYSPAKGDDTYQLCENMYDGLNWIDTIDNTPEETKKISDDGWVVYVKTYSNFTTGQTPFTKKLVRGEDPDALGIDFYVAQKDDKTNVLPLKDYTGPNGKNEWSLTIDGKSTLITFKVYGTGDRYSADSSITGEYEVKINGGGGGGEGGGGTVSGNAFYVDDLNPDIFEYTASAIEPNLTVRLVKDPLTILKENKDYYVKYENNYYPGVETAKATVLGINNYAEADSQEVTYSIKKNIAECPLEVENGAYTGQLVQPAVHVFDYETEAELVAGTDYVVTRYENNVKKGKNTAKAYVEGIGKYFGDNSGKFSILKTTSSTSKSTSSTSKSSSSTSSSSSSASSSGSSSSGSSSTSGNSSPGNQSPGSSGRAIPVDTGNSGLGDASGTIEGTTDNYVIKITKTAEADAEFNRALSEKYGDLSSYRQFAMDISLYDSTGEHKIEDPQGIAVTLTVPIPEELALYGGNNKVAAVDHGGNLENLSTRYSMIDGAPCATFTATHFSPYGFYVDTNNLSAGGLDNTPKTGDPISPKWVIAIGLAALSLFLFLKKDPVPHAAKA